MKKTFALLALAGVFVLAGCSSADTDGMPRQSTQQFPPGARQPEVAPVDWDSFELLQVTVSRSQRFGSVHHQVLGSFTDPEELALFSEAFRSAEKIEGQLDIRLPEYDLSFASGDGQSGFHLWLGQESGVRGIYMSIKDTGTGYTLSAGHTDRLRELIRSIPYDSAKAIANGDVVNVHGNFSNADQLTRFFSQVREGVDSEVHIVSYTKEGDPIFEDLLFDGVAIRYTYDNTMDDFGVPVRSTDYCKNVDQEGSKYILSKCDRDGGSKTYEFDIPTEE
ncbi:DUF4362 domain-containing protein [Paenibacillaceae bacterium WGS1546]|uniref:DUF4362 domain-containing protein n=1 Tax=Cohnella sp. WGS1546 TaxID=3366810 RepID=UPI00372CF6BD